MYDERNLFTQNVQEEEPGRISVKSIPDTMPGSEVKATHFIDILKEEFPQASIEEFNSPERHLLAYYEMDFENPEDKTDVYLMFKSETLLPVIKVSVREQPGSEKEIEIIRNISNRFNTLRGAGFRENFDTKNLNECFVSEIRVRELVEDFVAYVADMRQLVMMESKENALEHAKGLIRHPDSEDIQNELVVGYTLKRVGDDEYAEIFNPQGKVVVQIKIEERVGGMATPETAAALFKKYFNRLLQVDFSE